MLWVSLLIFPAITNADIPLPIGTYTQPVSNQGFVMRSMNGQWYAYWVDGLLKRYPSIGHNIDLKGHRIEYIHWNVDGTKFIIGSASGNNGKGWAWVVNVNRFTVSRKLEGNIAAAWFENSKVVYIRTIGKRQLYVSAHKRKWLPYSVSVTASAKDGKFWLARTSLRHDHGYRGNLVIMRNDHGAPISAAFVQESMDFPDVPSELITTDGNKTFVITLCRNQSHIGLLSSAIFVDLKNHDATINKLNANKDLFFFNLDVYRIPQGFAGICRSVDDQRNNTPQYAEYRYILNHGKVINKARIRDKMLAYSADINGYEVYILEHNGKVFIQRYKITYNSKM